MRYYMVDAFADALFEGNPAGVCVLDAFPEASLMQKIAQENNLSETAFVVQNGGYYDLRWFTPAVEIELCGHATLATGYVLSTFYDSLAKGFEFRTMSGPLVVTQKGNLFEMDFPARTQEKVPVTDAMREAVGAPVLSAYAGYNLMLELESEEDVRHLAPDIGKIKALSDFHGVIVTAPGTACDFVSRFFAPNVGVNEDPVTGSTHTSLVPYWAERLGKDELVARQLSARGGTLWCRNEGDRVFIAGKARLYMTGELLIADA